MARKSYTVLFASTAVGQRADPLARDFQGLFARHGANWPVVRLGGGEDHQVRDVQQVGNVWRGVFAKLRDDAPHKVNLHGHEHELDLDPGDRLIDKCHFTYREHLNVLVWQVNRSAGGLNMFQAYLSNLIPHQMVTLPPIQHSDRLDEVLNGQVYELQFDFSRPADNFEGQLGAVWRQPVMDLITGPHAAMARVKLKAPRLGFMQGMRRYLRQLSNDPHTTKVKVRLTGETKLSDLIMAPLRESLEVELQGLYPRAIEVFQELELAYDRQRLRLEAHRGQ